MIGCWKNICSTPPLDYSIKTFLLFEVIFYNQLSDFFLWSSRSHCPICWRTTVLKVKIIAFFLMSDSCKSEPLKTPFVGNDRDTTSSIIIPNVCNTSTKVSAFPIADKILDCHYLFCAFVGNWQIEPAKKCNWYCHFWDSN